MIKSVYDMINYNKNASLLTIDNPNKDNLEFAIEPTFKVKTF